MLCHLKVSNLEQQLLFLPIQATPLQESLTGVTYLFYYYMKKY